MDTLNTFKLATTSGGEKCWISWESAPAVAPVQQAIGAAPAQVAAQGANQNQNGQASGQNAANGGQGEPDSGANAAE